MSPKQVARLLFLAITLFAGTDPTRAAEISARAVAAKLDLLSTNLAAQLTAHLRTNVVTGSYTTVWRQFEDQAIVALEEILPRYIPELSATNFNAGRAGREKNRLADFAIVCATNVIEISVKSANASGNPENDLGTFRDHPNRQQMFAASFTVWVRYSKNAEAIQVDRVFFDRTWRFVGKSTLVDGVKYRKKDGNLRPKPWKLFDSGETYWESEADFEAAVARSETYRANELVKEYLEELPEEDQRLLHERLHEKFAPP